MELIEDGSILPPAGFLAGSSRCGLKERTGDPDIAILAGEGEFSCAGVFTRNLFAAAPVVWSRSILPADSLRAVAVNSGNANACTGRQGMEDAVRMADIVASLAGCRPQQVAVASTGVIGRRLPMSKVQSGLEEAFFSLSADPDAAKEAEKAIMTTDTRPKSCAVRVDCEGGPVLLGGMAKGAGMIAPDMATMLAFITTDIAAESAGLREILARCADDTFNMVTVDGDTSTNDSVFLAASGRSGAECGDPETKKRFTEGLHLLMEDLAIQIAADGEGATKLVEVRVEEARNRSDAVRAARAIADSLLVKCAINGEDPNWGRIVCAAGRSGAKIIPENTELLLGKTTVMLRGLPTGNDARAELKSDRVLIEMRLGAGQASARAWTCDISKQYVEINAEYHT